MKIRVRFGKHGAMKFIGHLDMMRYFQKALRRARIPMKYSQGYHPHPILSFAEPLGLGITSDGEYMDLELKEEMTSQEGLEALQKTMVEGVNVYSFRALPDKAKNAMASVEASLYRITYRKQLPPFHLEQLQEAKERFFDQATEIRIIKKTKKSERQIDLRPLIYQWQILPFEPSGIRDRSLEEDEGLSAWKFTPDPSDLESGPYCHRIQISSGSVDNIKPELLLEYFHRFLGLDPEEYPIRIYREDIFTRLEGGLVSLDAIGQDI